MGNRKLKKKAQNITRLFNNCKILTRMKTSISSEAPSQLGAEKVAFSKT